MVVITNQPSVPPYTFNMAGSAVPNAVNEPGVVAYEYNLFQNHPNPFNPTTTIEYEIAGRTNVQLDVYNSLGERVATLVNSEETAGHYSAVFDASALPEGVYFYRLRTQGYTEMRIMNVLK
jgi:hypothetical protein